MKTQKVILVLAISLGILSTSCNNDSDNNNNGNNTLPLEGKWNATKVGTIVAGQEILIDPPQNEDGCQKDYLEFYADNSVTAGDYDSSDSPCVLQTATGTYTKSGNTLTTVIDGTNRTETILNLTDTQLKLKDESGAIAVFTKA
ncbi:lipocalin family protein [Flavobacterium sp.]|uniref:lipocalin family protein n=1 Tax=Flavobacterium sp. TaxID=239 RepID=UPI0026392610|nr:lipocalin family protein [Flavobacterium sp.]